MDACICSEGIRFLEATLQFSSDDWLLADVGRIGGTGSEGLADSLTLVKAHERGSPILRDIATGGIEVVFKGERPDTHSSAEPRTRRRASRLV
jgi:hypothetical protein